MRSRGIFRGLTFCCQVRENIRRPAVSLRARGLTGRLRSGGAGKNTEISASKKRYQMEWYPSEEPDMRNSDVGAKAFQNKYNPISKPSIKNVSPLPVISTLVRGTTAGWFYSCGRPSPSPLNLRARANLQVGKLSESHTNLPADPPEELPAKCQQS